MDMNRWTDGMDGQMEQVDRCEWVDRWNRWKDGNGWKDVNRWTDELIDRHEQVDRCEWVARWDRWDRWNSWTGGTGGQMSTGGQM